MNALRNEHLTVKRHDDCFDQSTEDQDWLSSIGEWGWVALTKDKRIYHRPNERDAMFYAGSRLFVLVGKATFPELAENFIACIPKIERFLEKNTPPFIARVYLPTPEQQRRGSRKSGRVELWLSHADWLKKLGR